MTPAYDYSGADIEASLANVGVQSGDVVFVQSSLGMLGRPEGATNIEEACGLLDQALQNVVGMAGTIVVPTYTYSFCEGKPFDARATPSTIGPFAEFFRQKPDATRSCDPIFSVAAIGPRTSEIISDLPHDCFGPGSVYDRLCGLNAIIVTVGLGMEYATFRHHAEQMAGIPSRFLKTFSGVIEDIDEERQEAWLYYVPALIENCEAAGRVVAIEARETGAASATELGRSQVWGTRAAWYRQFLIETLTKDSWKTSRGPAVDVVSEERKRGGVASSEKLTDVPYVVSANARFAVDNLAERFDLKIYEWRTGDRFGDWVVPENWQLHDVKIAINDNDPLIAGSDYEVVGNSATMSETLTGAELKQHLNRQPQHNMDWALKDISGQLAQVSDDAGVVISIDANKSVDHLRVAGLVSNIEPAAFAVFMCLSTDAEKDASACQALIQSSSKDSGNIYVLPAPMAAIPIIESLKNKMDFFYVAPSVEWSDVAAILNRNGLNIEFNHYQDGATPPQQEHA